jgi:hypothetical protein
MLHSYSCVNIVTQARHTPRDSVHEAPCWYLPEPSATRTLPTRQARTPQSAIPHGRAEGRKGGAPAEGGAAMYPTAQAPSKMTVVSLFPISQMLMCPTSITTILVIARKMTGGKVGGEVAMMTMRKRRGCMSPTTARASRWTTLGSIMQCQSATWPDIAAASLAVVIVFIVFIFLSDGGIQQRGRRTKGIEEETATMMTATRMPGSSPGDEGHAQEDEPTQEEDELPD